MAVPARASQVTVHKAVDAVLPVHQLNVVEAATPAVVVRAAIVVNLLVADRLFETVNARWSFLYLK